MMYFQDIKKGKLYRCTDILGIEIKDWCRNKPTPNELSINYPLLKDNDLFMVLDVVNVKNMPLKLYDVKILSADGHVGWLFLWKQYKFPADELLEIS